jgi:hypothetical protein
MELTFSGTMVPGLNGTDGKDGMVNGLPGNKW